MDAFCSCSCRAGRRRNAVAGAGDGRRVRLNSGRRSTLRTTLRRCRRRGPRRGPRVSSSRTSRRSASRSRTCCRRPSRAYTPNAPAPFCTRKDFFGLFARRVSLINRPANFEDTRSGFRPVQFTPPPNSTQEINKEDRSSALELARSSLP